MAKDARITLNLAAAQIAHAAARPTPAASAVAFNRTLTLFTLWTEYRPSNAPIVARYFQGATLTRAVGLWDTIPEDSQRIDIIAPIERLQDVLHLAGDIRETQGADSVYVTHQTVQAFDIRRPESA